MCFDGVEPGEDHRLDLFKTRQRLDGGPVVIGDGVPDLGIGNGLQVGHQEADFAGDQLLDLHRLWSKHSQRLHLRDFAVPP